MAGCGLDSLVYDGIPDGACAMIALVTDGQGGGDSFSTHNILVGNDDVRCSETIEHNLGAAENADCWRLLYGIALMAADPSIVEPAVLAADERRAEEARAAGDQATLDRLVDKARRRGKNEWNVGRRLEVDPHYRRPHLGLRWTGEGGKIPRIVPVKGAIVHRQRMTAVPTGYMDKEIAK